MLSRVVVFQVGIGHELRSWNEWEKLFSCNTESAGERRWEELCVTLAAGAKQEAETFVCICLLHDELVLQRDRGALLHVLRQARRSTWGARVLLVLTRRARIPPDDEDSVRDWLAAAVRGEALDLVQVDYDQDNPDSLSFGLLREALARAADRRRVVGALPARGVWRCIVPIERPRIRKFLAPYLQPDHAALPDDGVGLVIVLKGADAASQEVGIEECREKYGDRRYLVTCLQPASAALKTRCRALHLPEPLEMAGDFELWYLIVRLNALAEGQSAWGHGTSVALREAPTFLPPPPAAWPTLLLTSSIDPFRASECVAAAATFGSLLDALPRHLQYRVEPTLDRRGWLDAMQTVPRPAIWVHLATENAAAAAPGLPPTGLDPTSWMAELAPGGCDLALALLLASDSARPARHLASAGVALAVSFGGTVRTPIWRDLAQAMVRAAGDHGVSQEVLLGAFRAAVARFSPEEAGGSRPVAYYPRQL